MPRLQSLVALRGHQAEVVGVIQVGYCGAPDAEVQQFISRYDSDDYDLVLWDNAKGDPHKQPKPLLMRYVIDDTRKMPKQLTPPPPKPKTKPESPNQPSLF